MATPTIGASALTRRGVFVAAAAALVSAACGRNDDSGTASGKGSQELVIGVSLELTGSAASLGILQERALRITLPSLNEEGVPVGNLRRTVQLLIRDNASNPKIAAQHASEMVARDKVHAIIGGTVAETSLAIVAVAEELQVPFISLAAADDIVLPLSRRTFIYKLTPDATDVSRRLARLIASHKLDRVAVLAAAGKHGDAGARAMKESLETADLKLTTRVVRLPASGANFGSAARRVTASDCDAVVIWATAPDSGAAARALRGSGYDGPIYFDAGAVAEDTLSSANVKAVNGAWVVHPLSLDGSSLTNTTRAGLARRDFVLRYVQEHGSFAGFAPYASDALQLIVTAARLANSVDRGRLRVYLETQIAEGIAGSYAFTPINHGGMQPDSLAVFRLRQGAWVHDS